MPLTKSRALGCLILGVLLCGCGGSGDNAAAPNGQGRGELRRRQPKRDKPVAKRASSARKRARSAKPSVKNEIPADVNPRDVFVVLGEGPTFEIAGEAPKVDSEDLFAAVIPDDGVDSSYFVLETERARPSRRPAGRRFSLPDGFTELAEFGYSEKGLPLRILCNKDGAEMALVPAGVFRLGKTDGPPESSPELSIYLSDYYIDVTEVTVEQYARFHAGIEPQRRARAEPTNRTAPSDHPVLGVRWHDARRYARWAGKELPTEAEWEKAARGPESFDRVWGHGRAVWPVERLTDQIDPVASFPTDASTFGVFDLAGNAREWCQDAFSDVAYQEASRANAATLRNWDGPRRPSIENHRVVKGNGPDWVAWYRTGRHELQQHADVGFRCVLRLPEPE